MIEFEGASYRQPAAQALEFTWTATVAGSARRDRKHRFPGEKAPVVVEAARTVGRIKPRFDHPPAERGALRFLGRGGKANGEGADAESPRDRSKRARRRALHLTVRTTPLREG